MEALQLYVNLNIHIVKQLIDAPIHLCLEKYALSLV